MPRNLVTKIDILSKMYRWKNSLHMRNDLNSDMKYGYDVAINDVLELMKEFRE